MLQWDSDRMKKMVGGLGSAVRPEMRSMWRAPKGQAGGNPPTSPLAMAANPAATTARSDKPAAFAPAMRTQAPRPMMPAPPTPAAPAPSRPYTATLTRSAMRPEPIATPVVAPAAPPPAMSPPTRAMPSSMADPRPSYAPVVNSTPAPAAQAPAIAPAPQQDNPLREQFTSLVTMLQDPASPPELRARVSAAMQRLASNPQAEAILREVQMSLMPPAVREQYLAMGGQ